MKRTTLRDRILPTYSRGEEIMNMVTHIVGGGFGIIVLTLCLRKTISLQYTTGILCSIIYGFCMIAVYTVSSIYHGLLPCTGKKAMQVVDHCTIYLLIAGTYTPIVVCAIAPVYPVIGWGLLSAEWILAAIAITLTAIDLRKYRAFSMICYIGMGWAVIFFLPQTMTVLGATGFAYLLAGGIAYTIGAILFGIGRKQKWIHSVFHIFVVFGSILQFITIFIFVL